MMVLMQTKPGEMLKNLKSGGLIMEDKVCPMKFSNYILIGECTKDGCAWWDGKQCAILTLAKGIKVSVAK